MHKVCTTQNEHEHALENGARSGTSTTVTSLYLDLAKPSFSTDLSGEGAGMTERAKTTGYQG